MKKLIIFTVCFILLISINLPLSAKKGQSNDERVLYIAEKINNLDTLFEKAEKLNNASELSDNRIIDSASLESVGKTAVEELEVYEAKEYY